MSQKALEHVETLQQSVAVVLLTDVFAGVFNRFFDFLGNIVRVCGIVRVAVLDEVNELTVVDWGFLEGESSMKLQA
jgi:hypothetical protein